MYGFVRGSIAASAYSVSSRYIEKVYQQEKKIKTKKTEAQRKKNEYLEENWYFYVTSIRNE